MALLLLLPLVFGITAYLSVNKTLQILGPYLLIYDLSVKIFVRVKFLSKFLFSSQHENLWLVIL